MTSQEISRIHNKKLATPNKKYYSDDGKVYLGTADGRLEILQKAVVTDIKQIPELTTKNVQASLEVLAKDFHILQTSDFATVAYVDEEIEHAKCYALAMSIIL